MAKIAQRYVSVDPFKIIENGFHPERSKVSESLFSLANEYCGIRGTFDEGSSFETLRGSYFNGVYDYAKEDTPIHYKGIIQRTHFMINSVDWIKVGIKLDHHSVKVDAKTKGFRRELDMTSGLLTREFDYETDQGNYHLCFTRFLSMVDCHRAYQTLEITSDHDTTVDLEFFLDSKVLHWGHDCYYKGIKNYHEDDMFATINETLTTGQKVASFMHLDIPQEGKYVNHDRGVSVKYTVAFKAGQPRVFTRFVVNLVDKDQSQSVASLIKDGVKELRTSVNDGYLGALEKNKAFWQNVWDKSDIVIEGDPLNQQGIRFNIFQLTQTYHGFDPHNNIGAKGLTGEAYSGHAFWDSETYCLPFYLFNNPNGAKNLLMFRYYTLPQAIERAGMLDCKGACYPIATLNGKEGCNLWQHASLQFQPSTGVAYGIFHYFNVTHDVDFLLDYGFEMLLQISNFLLSRGQWSQDGKHFGFYCVMGPDEFQMMVNHNTYTNLLAKKTFEFTLSVMKKFNDDPRVAKALAKTGLSAKELSEFARAAEHTLILYDEKTKLYEQHQGFFDLPHIDPDSIPVEEFPLYAHWSYDRIYRNDLVKQPDVLMFMFLYSHDFTLDEKKANYEFYEPRCIHESSLSPSIHSIFASELGKEKEALDFFGFATRMDLDDYNRNAGEGLHTTSIAAAWMNIVYGFGGLRSDSPSVTLAPTIPSIWTAYQFKINVQNQSIGVKVTHEEVLLSKTSTEPLELVIYGCKYVLKETLRIKR